MLKVAVDGVAEHRADLVGFLRGTTMNVYAGADRIVTEDAPVATPG